MAERPIAEGTIRFSPDMRSLANVEKSVKKAIGRIEGISARGGLLSKNYVQPLGQITGAADEFTKSLEASNARVIAFGASAGIIYNVQRALTASVGAAVNLEKTLADINVILNETNKGLQRFSGELFNIAKGTGQTFNAVSEAALEFARQGLAVEETLKRTRDAMILVRLSGLDVKSSVESITATLNSFNQTVINSTELVNKLANVDAAFAVSSADLAEAIRRVGSSAQDANVNIDQLIALVTTAQQVTARGGSVIGNSLKTIFTRLQRPAVIADLEAFGVVVRDQQGFMLDTMRVLQNFANTYDQLAPSAKAVTAELVGGVFQINVLKAALGDLGKQYSIYDRALNISLTSTDQAIARNELLNKTLSTLINETLINVQKVGAAFANLTITPTLTNVLESVNSAVEKLEQKASEGDLGVTFGKGILQGLSNVLSGPALIAIAGILGKLTFSFFKFSSDAVKTFAGLNNTANQQKEVQTLIQNLLIKNPSLIASATSNAEALKMVEGEILKIVKARNVALKESAALAAKFSSKLTVADLKSVNASGTTASKGFVPNYNRKNEQAEIAGALQGGYMPGQVQTMKVKGVGTVTWNDAETVKTFPGMMQPAIMPPRDSDAGRNYEQRFKSAHGFNPYHQGMIPNFALDRISKERSGKVSKVVRTIDGDTITAPTSATNSYRLHEIDAVESSQRLGSVATKLLQGKVSRNQDRWINSVTGGKAAYGRGVFADKRFQRELVRKGLGVPDLRYASYNEYKSLVDEARQAKRGIWKDSRHPKVAQYLAQERALITKGGNVRERTQKIKDQMFGAAKAGRRAYAFGGFIPNLAYEGLHDEDLGSAFINVNEANKGKSIDYNLTRKDIEKRLGGKTLIRGPEGETLIVGGDLEGRAGSITVGGLSARKIKKANPKYAMLLDQVPGLFDGLAYEVMGAVGAKFDREGASGAVAGVKFEEEFAQAHGLPAAGAKKGSDFILADKMAKELGTQKHLQLKLSVFERSKRDVKKVVDVASSFSKYLVDMLTHNIKTQGLSRVVGPQRFKAAMGVLAKNPAIKNSWSGYFGKGGTMSGGFVPNFYLAESADYYALAQQKEDEEVAELMSGRAQPSWKFGMYDKARAAGNTEDHANVDRVLAGQGQALRAMGVPEFISAYGTGRIKVPRPGMTFNTHDSKMRDRMRASGEVKGKDRITYNAVYNEEDARRNVARRKHAIRTGMSASQFRQSFQKSNTSQIDNSVGMLREQKRVTAQEIKDEIHKSAAAGLAGSYGHWSQMAPKNSVAAQYYGAIEGMFKRAHGEVSKILTTSTKDFVKNKGIRSTGVHSSTVGGREFGTEMSHELLTRGNPLLSELESIDIAPSITGGGGGLQEVEQGAIASARSSGFIKQGQEAIQKYVEDLENMVINTLGRKAFEVAASEQKMNMFSKFRAFGPKQLKEMGTFSNGMIPNFARTAIQDAISREMGAGYSRSQVKVGYDSRLAASGGIGVYNTTEGSLSRAINMHRASGKSMKSLQTQGASSGAVPNYAADFGDFAGGGLAFALIAPALSSFTQSIKDAREEREKESKGLKDAQQARDEATQAFDDITDKISSNADTIQNAESRIEQAKGKRTEAVQGALAATREKAQRKQSTAKFFDMDDKDLLDSLGVSGKMGGRDAELQGLLGTDADALRSGPRTADDIRMKLLEKQEEELKALDLKIEAHKATAENLSRQADASEEIKNKAQEEAAAMEKEQKERREQVKQRRAENMARIRAARENREARGNRLASQFGTSIAFGAPMIAGQASTLFQAAGGSQSTAAGINAFGTGLGSAGAAATAFGEMGESVRGSALLRRGAARGGALGGLAKGARLAARFAGPAAAVVGGLMAIDKAFKAAAKAKVKAKADEVGSALEKVSQKFNRVQQSGQAFMQSFDKLQQAMKDPLSTNAADFGRVQADLAKALSDAPADFRAQIKAAGGDAEKIRQIFNKITVDLQNQQNALKGAKDIFELQANLGAGGGLFSALGMGDGDTRIFEDDAEGKKAFAAFQAAAGTSLNRDKLVKAVEDGRNVDLSTAGAQEEFFGKNFANAVQSQSKQDRADMVRYFQELLAEITTAVKDAAVVAKDLKERQEREKAYRDRVKKLNDELKGLQASLASATRQTEQAIITFQKMGDSFKNFQLDFAKADVEGAAKLSSPFLSRVAQTRQDTQLKQLQIRSDSLKELRNIISSGTQDILKVGTKTFSENAQKVEQFAGQLQQRRSRENEVNLRRQQKTLESLGPIVQSAFAQVAQDPSNTEALQNLPDQIRQALTKQGIPSEKIEELTSVVRANLQESAQRTTDALALQLQKQDQMLKLEERQAYWAEESVKLQERIASFGGAGDFSRQGQTSLSGNFDKLVSTLDQALKGVASGNPVDTGRAQFSLLDNLINGLNLTSLREVDKIAPLLGGAIAGRALDIEQQLGFSERLAGAMGFQGEFPTVDAEQLATEQIFSQLKLNQLPDSVDEIRKNTAALNRLIERQGQELVGKNSEAFDKALKANGMQNLSPLSAASVITAQQGVLSINNVQEINRIGFGLLGNNFNTGLGGVSRSISSQTSMLQTTLNAMRAKSLQLEQETLLKEDQAKIIELEENQKTLNKAGFDARTKLNNLKESKSPVFPADFATAKTTQITGNEDRFKKLPKDVQRRFGGMLLDDLGVGGKSFKGVRVISGKGAPPKTQKLNINQAKELFLAQATKVAHATPKGRTGHSRSQQVIEQETLQELAFTLDTEFQTGGAFARAIQGGIASKSEFQKGDLRRGRTGTTVRVGEKGTTDAGRAFLKSQFTPEQGGTRGIIREGDLEAAERASIAADKAVKKNDDERVALLKKHNEIARKRGELENKVYKVNQKTLKIELDTDKTKALRQKLEKEKQREQERQRALENAPEFGPGNDPFGATRDKAGNALAANAKLREAKLADAPTGDPFAVALRSTQLNPQTAKFSPIVQAIEKATTQQGLGRATEMLKKARSEEGITKQQIAFLKLLEKQINQKKEEIKKEDENKKKLEKISEERRKQLEFLKSLNGTLDRQQKQALLNLQREIEVRKALDANANAIKQSLTDQVRMGDPEQIQDGIVKNLRSGLTSLIGPDQRNVELSKQAEKILTARRKEVLDLGKNKLGFIAGMDADLALSEAGDDPLAAAQKLLADKKINKEQFDELSKAMQEGATEARKKAEKEIAGLTAQSVKNTTSRLLEDDLSSKTSDDFTKDIQKRFAAFEKQGTKLSQEEFKNLRQSRRKKLDEEFDRNQTNRKRQQQLDSEDSKQRSAQIISDQKEGLTTESKIAEQIQRRFKEFKELGNAFDPNEIEDLRKAQKAQREEEFNRELKNLKTQKTHELEDVQTNLDEGIRKAAAGLSSAAEMNQLISQSIETFIQKGTDMSLISEKIKALKIEEQNKRFETLNNRMEAFRKGMGNINDVMSNLQQNIDALVLDQGVDQFDERVSTIAQQAREANSLALEDYTRQFQVTEKLYAEGAVSLDYLKGKIAQLNDQAMKTGEYDATNFFASIREEFTYGQEQYYRDLDTMGRDFVRDFKGGIAGAFGEAIRGTKSLKQAFAEMFANLADKMLDKSLNMAVNSAFGALGFQQFNKGGHVKGYNSGGIVKGGSGIKDDVPAYLSRGEYVIRKKTVNEYGKNFFDSLNSAKVVAANKGGVINNTKLTAEAADRVFGGKARNMAALQAEKQKRMAALQRAGIESYGYKEATDQTKKDIFGRDTGQKILSNRVGFRLDFGKPLNERRVRDIQNAVKAYPEIGPFIDPDIFKRSTVEIGGGATKLKLKNSFIYNETKRPDQGRFIADPRLSSLALNDENNPQNKYKFEKADNFFNYQKERLEYYAEKQKELQDFQDQKANRRRSFLFGAAALLFAGRGFAKGGQNKEDDIPALLTGGEYVVRKGIVDKYGLNFFENLNRGKISAFNKGGYVAPVTGARPTTEFEGGESRASGVDNVSNTNNISISVNIDNAGAVTTETKQGGSTSTNPQSQEEAKRLGDQIKSAVVNVIAEQKRPGGMLYGTPGSV